MKVFISWSGARSKQVAEALRGWLPNVIQDVDPWMSDADIDAGSRSLPEITKALEEANFGVSCLTSDNTEAPWLLFEAGALSKFAEAADPRVCTYLLDLKSVDFSGPLSSFQWKKADKEGTRAILQSMNSANKETPIKEQQLDNAFEKFWPELENKLGAVPAPAESDQPKRQPDEMLAETLQLARGIMRLQAETKTAIDFLMSQPAIQPSPLLEAMRLGPYMPLFKPPEFTVPTESTVTIPTVQPAGEPPSEQE